MITTLFILSSCVSNKNNLEENKKEFVDYYNSTLNSDAFELNITNEALISNENVDWYNDEFEKILYIKTPYMLYTDTNGW